MDEHIYQALERLRSKASVDPNARHDVPPFRCIPGCEICGGTGWVRLDVPRTDERWGKLQPCPNMDVIGTYAARSGLSQVELNLDLKDVAITDNDIGTAISVIQSTLQRGYGWVYLWGSYGRAKSLLCKVAVATSLRSRQIAAYIRMTSFLDDLRLAFDQDNPNFALQEKVTWWTGVPVLAIDELEKTNTTGFSRERTFQLLDTRYAAATDQRKGVTIMASNLPPAALDPYLTDRIRDGRFSVIEMSGPSMRPMMDY